MKQKDKKQFTHAQLQQVRIGTAIIVIATLIALLKNMWWVCFISAGICLVWIAVIATRYRP